MRSPRLVLFFPLKIGGDQKRSSLLVMKPLIFSKALQFLRGPWLQPAEPIAKPELVFNDLFGVTA